MILRAVNAVAALALATFVVVPAHADVLEIGAATAKAQWISGPHAVLPAGREPRLGLRSEAAGLVEIPAEAALVPGTCRRRSPRSTRRHGTRTPMLPRLPNFPPGSISARR